MRHLALALTLALLSCNGDTDPTDTAADTDTDTDTDADTDSDTDTDVPCTPDVDRDGFCPPEDCDDNDVFVNPAFDEEPGDDKDNNCDGRVDEEFSRVVAWEVDQNTGVSLFLADPLGDFKGRIGATEPLAMTYASLDRDLRTFVGWNGSGIYKYDINGSVTAVASIPDDFEWLNDEDEPDPPPGINDFTMHPDGYYLVAAADRLLKFDESGVWSTIAQWPCLEEDESHEMCAWALSTNTETREVLMLGFFGGVAKWHPEDGYTLITPSNPEEPGPSFQQAQHKRFGTTFALASYTDEAEGPSMGMFQWNEAVDEMRFLGRFPTTDWTPQSFSIEDDTGDFYFAVNSAPTGSNGAWDNHLWRMTADGTYATDLYKTEPGTNDANFFTAAVIHYTQDD